ncbi:hypothetical protein ACMD2_16191 [Ananas comosus]|uniref:Uncharacterized protein n=1 Tax=Ananas comosus TaxID=4615 RepID=A0A199W0K9_ANACO|nr:hypothetical protein ACMD2_16191 [Ananas comosus]
MLIPKHLINSEIEQSSCEIMEEIEKCKESVAVRNNILEEERDRFKKAAMAVLEMLNGRDVRLPRKRKEKRKREITLTISLDRWPTSPPRADITRRTIQSWSTRNPSLATHTYPLIELSDLFPLANFCMMLEIGRAPPPPPLFAGKNGRRNFSGGVSVPRISGNASRRGFSATESTGGGFRRWMGSGFGEAPPWDLSVSDEGLRRKERMDLWRCIVALLY